MSTLKANNIQHLDASTPSIQVNSVAGTVLTGVSTVSSTLITGADPNDGGNAGVKLLSSGVVQAARASGSPGSAVFMGFVEGDTSANTRINANGSGFFMGDVGIGTDNPGRLLDVSNTDNTTYTAAAFVDSSEARIHNFSTTQDSFASLSFRTGTADNAIGFKFTGTANQADFVIVNDGGANGVERLRITSDGDVGIGTISPNAKLQVAGNQPETWCHDYTAAGSGSNNGAAFIISRDNDDTLQTDDRIGRVRWRGQASDAPFIGAEITAQLTNGNTNRSNTTCDLIFGTMASGDTGALDKMVLAANGRLGINSTSPTRRLDVLETASQTVAQFKVVGQTKSLTRYQIDGETAVFVGAGNSDFEVQQDGTTTLRISGETNNIIPSNNVTYNDGRGSDFTNAGGGTVGSAVTASNLLDAYEEGTWTPIFTSSGATIAGESIYGTDYDIQNGRYVRFGKTVIASFRCRLDGSAPYSNGGADGQNFFVGGFPYDSANIADFNFTGSIGWASGLSGTWSSFNLNIIMTGNTNHAVVSFMGNTGASELQTTNVTASFQLIGNMVYEID